MISVRQATKKDVDIIYNLIIGIAKHHNQEQYVLTSKEELLSSGFGENPKFGVLLAEVDGEVAGYASYTLDYVIWLGGVMMRIDDVFVWEKYRGQKAGEALMNQAKKVCLELGMPSIRWEVQSDNHGAIRFYERLGAICKQKSICVWRVS